MTDRHFECSDRLKKLPPYIFVQIDKVKKEEIAKGRKLFSLGIGDPDLPPPSFITERLIEAVKRPDVHQYPAYAGMLELRKAIASWYDRRFGVKADPNTEVLTLIGSKEGLAHLPLAFINPGDAALVPDPGYPVYANGTLFAGGTSLRFPLLEKNNYFPDFAQLDKLVRDYNRAGQRVRLLFLNYPNNPTAACATEDLFRETVAFARKHEIIVCHDNAYSEVYYDGKPQPSFLQTPGAMEVGCETHSLSKTFNMAGWRVGFLVGNEKIVKALGEIKTNIDSGVFNACQEAAIVALNQYEPFTSSMRATYQERRDILLPAVRAAGLETQTPAASFYIWSHVPAGMSSSEYVMKLIKEKGIVTLPGDGFGQAGSGYVRFSLCQDVVTLKKVAELLKS